MCWTRDGDTVQWIVTQWIVITRLTKYSSTELKNSERNTGTGRDTKDLQ